MLKRFNLFFSISFSIFLLAISLVKLDKMPEIGVDFGDKIFHLGSYMVLSFLWFNTSLYRFKFRKSQALIFSFVFSILFGIIIEILQSVLTTYRTLDVYDILSNSVGVLITLILLAINKNIDVKIT